MQIQNVAYTTFNGAEMTKIHIRVLSDELEQMNVYKKGPSRGSLKELIIKEGLIAGHIKLICL